MTTFGIFVELREIYVEGLVHVTALKNDYYHFDSARHRLQGERTGKNYRLADPVRIKVMRVDLDSKKIDFELAGEEGSAHAVSERGAKEHLTAEPKVKAKRKAKSSTKKTARKKSKHT